MRTKREVDNNANWKIINKYKNREENDPVRVGDYIILQNAKYPHLRITFSNDNLPDDDSNCHWDRYKLKD